MLLFKNMHLSITVNEKYGEGGGFPSGGERILVKPHPQKDSY